MRASKPQANLAFPKCKRKQRDRSRMRLTSLRSRRRCCPACERSLATSGSGARSATRRNIKRIQVLALAKSHVNDALAIACQSGETVRPLPVVYHHRCIGRGNYQRFNGKHSGQKVWAARKVRGFKLYELVEAKGQVGYIAGRREKGAFVLKEVASGKKLLEVSPSKLLRRARPTHGWIIQSCPQDTRKEGDASSPS